MGCRIVFVSDSFMCLLLAVARFLSSGGGDGNVTGVIGQGGLRHERAGCGTHHSSGTLVDPG